MKPEEACTPGASKDLRDRYRDYYVATVDAADTLERKKKEEGRLELEAERKEKGLDSKEKKNAAPSALEDGLDLWKAYWVSKIKLALAEAKSDYHRPITKVTFVAIHGGGLGAEYERKELTELGELIRNRGRIEGIANVFVNDIACCLSCGLHPRGLCPGWNSAIFYWQAAAKRAMFCTPIKGLDMKFVIAAPSDLEACITRQSGTLVEFQLQAARPSMASKAQVEKEIMVKAPKEQVWGDDDKLVL